MKRTINETEFRDAFRDMDRGDQFSYNGLGALFEYLEEIEEGGGPEMELNPIAICCDFSEYPSAWDAMLEYQPDDMPVVDLESMVDEDGTGPDLPEVEEAQQAAALEWLREQTQVIEVEGGGVIIAAF